MTQNIGIVTTLDDSIQVKRLCLGDLSCVGLSCMVLIVPSFEIAQSYLIYVRVKVR